MKSPRRAASSNPTELKPGDIEFEMGVPIPGVIVDQDKWAKTALKKLPESGALNLAEIFGRAAPIAIDIGCGNGRFVLSSALRRPDWDHLAIDILPAVLRYATRRANQRGLSNIRFAACDGERLVYDLLEPSSIQEIHIYHPQPFANPKQHHRRMLNEKFVLQLRDRLAAGGQVYLQTDNDDYWKSFSQIFATHFAFEVVTQPWEHDLHGRSRREMLSKERGLNIHRAIAVKE